MGERRLCWNNAHVLIHAGKWQENSTSVCSIRGTWESAGFGEPVTGREETDLGGKVPCEGENGRRCDEHKRSGNVGPNKQKEKSGSEAWKGRMAEGRRRMKGGREG